MPHTILTTKAPVKVGLVDLFNCIACGSMKQPALILNLTRIVGVQVLLLRSILAIQSWILDTLNFDNSSVVLTLDHGFFELFNCKLVSLTSRWKLNHT